MTWWYENEAEEMKLYKNEDLCIGCKNAFFSKPYDHRDPTPGQLGYCIKCDNFLIKDKKMEFDKSRVYTALNADELREGDMVIVANTMAELKRIITGEIYCIAHIMRVNDEDCENRFCIGESNATGDITYSLAYLVERKENCTNCGANMTCGESVFVKTTEQKVHRCENYKPKTEQKAEEKNCYNCRLNYTRDGVMRCMMNDHRCNNPEVACNHYEPTTFEPKTEKEDNMNWTYISEGKLPERQENGVSDRVVVAIEGYNIVDIGYYDYDLEGWFVEGNRYLVRVYAWQSIKPPRVEE